MSIHTFAECCSIAGTAWVFGYTAYLKVTHQIAALLTI